MKGTVYLVGAGPGDDKLITVRAVELLKEADVVLYDRLVSKKILSIIPSSAEKIYVGRSVGDDYKHQESTNQLMVKYARENKHVVRLKGGDPIMFGRGGEEAEFLKENNVCFEIIPGITSGIGSAAYSGIPLTHRSLASSVVFVTGHEDPKKENEAVKWKQLATSVDTIVIMMGISRIHAICKQLIEGGISKRTPVAVVEKGTTLQQRVIRGNVSNIHLKIRQKDVKPPSIVIIGNVVNLADKLDWR